MFLKWQLLVYMSVIGGGSQLSETVVSESPFEFDSRRSLRFALVSEIYSVNFIEPRLLG